MPAQNPFDCFLCEERDPPNNQYPFLAVNQCDRTIGKIKVIFDIQLSSKTKLANAIFQNRISKCSKNDNKLIFPDNIHIEFLDFQEDGLDNVTLENNFLKYNDVLYANSIEMATDTEIKPFKCNLSTLHSDANDANTKIFTAQPSFNLTNNKFYIADIFNNNDLNLSTSFHFDVLGIKGRVIPTEETMPITRLFGKPVNYTTPQGWLGNKTGVRFNPKTKKFDVIPITGSKFQINDIVCLANADGVIPEDFPGSLMGNFGSCGPDSRIKFWELIKKIPDNVIAVKGNIHIPYISNDYNSNNEKIYWRPYIGLWESIDLKGIYESENISCKKDISVKDIRYNTSNLCKFLKFANAHLGTKEFDQGANKVTVPTIRATFSMNSKEEDQSNKRLSFNDIGIAKSNEIYYEAGYFDIEILTSKINPSLPEAIKITVVLGGLDFNDVTAGDLYVAAKIKHKIVFNEDLLEAKRNNNKLLSYDVLKDKGYIEYEYLQSIEEPEKLETDATYEYSPFYLSCTKWESQARNWFNNLPNTGFFCQDSFDSVIPEGGAVFLSKDKPLAIINNLGTYYSNTVYYILNTINPIFIANNKLAWNDDNDNEFCGGIVIDKPANLFFDENATDRRIIEFQYIKYLIGDSKAYNEKQIVKVSLPFTLNNDIVLTAATNGPNSFDEFFKIINENKGGTDYINTVNQLIRLFAKPSGDYSYESYSGSNSPIINIQSEQVSITKKKSTTKTISDRQRINNTSTLPCLQKINDRLDEIQTEKQAFINKFITPLENYRDYLFKIKQVQKGSSIIEVPHPDSRIQTRTSWCPWSTDPNNVTADEAEHNRRILLYNPKRSYKTYGTPKMYNGKLLNPESFEYFSGFFTLEKLDGSTELVFRGVNYNGGILLIIKRLREAKLEECKNLLDYLEKYPLNKDYMPMNIMGNYDFQMSDQKASLYELMQEETDLEITKRRGFSSYGKIGYRECCGDGPLGTGELSAEVKANCGDQE